MPVSEAMTMNLIAAMALLVLVTWIARRRDPRSEADDLGLGPLRAERDHGRVTTGRR